MSTISTLALRTPETVRYDPVKDRDEYAEIMRDTNVLSRLTILVHNGDPFCDFILSQRPVERHRRPGYYYPRMIVNSMHQFETFRGICRIDSPTVSFTGYCTNLYERGRRAIS
jgi:hypothetical protein